MKKSASILSGCFLALAVVVQARQDETTRKLWDTAFISPPTTKRTKKPSARRRYRVATASVAPTHVEADTVVGVTLWRLRPARRSDTGERLLVHEGAGATDWIPERIEADTKLPAGTRVRLSVEAARSGYLYVIDREEYANGSFGEPYLIFPTTRTNRGQNEVRAGRVIEIPGQEDQPPFFTLTPSRPDQVSEVISVLITTAPLEGLQIGESMVKLEPAQVAAWEQSWGGSVGRLEMEQGAGRSWTKGEREAGADATRALDQSDPPPQTLYYKPDAKSGTPVMVNVQLRCLPSSRSPRRRR